MKIKSFLLISFFGINALIGQNSKIEVDAIIKNTSVITMTKSNVDKNQNIVIKEGKIIDITQNIKPYVSRKIIDGKNKFVMPSLSDAHVHFPETEEEFEKALKLYQINGVTRLRSMRGEIKHIEWKQKYNSQDSKFPKLYLSTIPISKNLKFDNAKLVSFVENSKNAGFDFIKLLSINSASQFKQLDSICKAKNFKIAGHFPSNAESINLTDEDFFNSEFTSIEHLGGLINPKGKLESRIKKIKEKGIYVCPTFRWYELSYNQIPIEELQKQKSLNYVSIFTINKWNEEFKKNKEKLGEAEFIKKTNELSNEINERLNVIKLLHQEKIPLLIGPDSSHDFSVYGFDILEEMKLFQKAGLSNYEILKAGTINFANYVKDNSFGSIEKNKNAELIILNGNPLEDLKNIQNIEGIYFNNSFLDKEKLKEISTELIPQN